MKGGWGGVVQLLLPCRRLLVVGSLAWVMLFAAALLHGLLGGPLYCPGPHLNCETAGLCVTKGP